MENVGLIGYGAIGSAFAERLALTGSRPFVYDIDPVTRDKARSDGFEIVGSPAELGEICHFVDVMVRTDDELVDATIGHNGASRQAKPGTILLLHPSTLPKTTLRIAKSVEMMGVEVVDACATGVPSAVRAGTLIFLVGSKPEVRDEIRPHLERMAKHVIFMGPPGAGNVSKLVKNLVTASERLIIWQALQIAEAGELNYVDVLNMMQLVRAEHPGLLEHWNEAFDPSGRNSLPWSGTNLFDKDIPLAAELGREYGLSLPLTEALVNAATLLLQLNVGRDLNHS